MSETEPPTPSAAPTSSDAPVVELRDVVVRYGRFTALDGVSLTLPAGLTGLVGRNGAGKSTLLRLLLGLVEPTEGGGSVLGVDLGGGSSRLRREVGYMPENDALLPGLYGVEQVALAAELCGLHSREAHRRAHEVINYVDLGEARYRRVEQYSTGMRQRLKLAVALAHDPKLLLLDEPTVGLDPPGRARMLRLVGDLTRRFGKSVVVSTHLMGDIEETCNTVVMMERGKVLRSGPLHAVLKQPENRWRLRWEKGDGRRFLQALAAVGAQRVDDDDRITDVAGFTPNETDAPTEAGVVVPLDFDPRRFFAAAAEAGVRLRFLDEEREDLGRLYHRLVAGELDGVDPAPIETPIAVGAEASS
ncbi:MAG: ABC transporter ATP-binding protein [Planctomycetia bacterium]